MKPDATTATSATGVFGDAPAPSLTVAHVITRMVEPTALMVMLACPDSRLFTVGTLAGPGLAARHILPGDLLLFDRGRTRPKDGEIVMIRHGDDWPARIYRETPTGVEFHAADPGVPPVVGEQRIHGTLVGLLRLDGETEGGRL